MLDVAACIVTYRSPIEEVRRAVASCLATSLDVRLTLVDNASGAAYLAELRALEGERVTALSSGRNGGFGFGHNAGIRAAPPCRYYLVLNPDVTIHADALETLVRYMDAHPDVGVVSPKVLYADGMLQPLNKRDPSALDLFLRRVAPGFWRRFPSLRARMDRYAMLDVGYDAPCEVEFLTGCFMLFRASVLERVGGFDERFFLYLEDADMTRRARAFAKAMYVPDAVITHAWRRGSHRSLRLAAVMLHSMWVYFAKWGWKWR